MLPVKCKCYEEWWTLSHSALRILEYIIIGASSTWKQGLNEKLWQFCNFHTCNIKCLMWTRLVSIHLLEVSV